MQCYLGVIMRNNLKSKQIAFNAEGGMLVGEAVGLYSSASLPTGCDASLGLQVGMYSSASLTEVGDAMAEGDLVGLYSSAS